MSDELVKRHMNGETYAGLEVMAYMEDCDTPMGVVPRFSSHWSTPGAGAKNVQRLFSQSQVDELLARISALEAALESERAEATRRKWEDWRQIATLARASAEAAEAELAKAEAALAKADALAGAVEFWTIAEELDVSDAIYRLKRTLTAYRQARDATR